MSKKSARSKGYRKTIEKKPYMTKKEITITIIAAVVIIAAFIGLNFIPDGSVKIVDGSAKVQGENSILASAVTNAGTKYFKLGQAHEFDGYEMTANAASSAVDNYCSYTYTAAAEDAPVDEIATCGYILQADAEQYTAYMQSAIAAIGEGIECGEMQSYKNDLGKKVFYYVYSIDDATVNAANAPAEEAAEETAEAVVEETVEETVEESAEEPAEETAEEVVEEETPNFHQHISGYIDLGDTRAIYVSLTNDAETTDEYVDEAELVDVFKAFVNTLTYEKK